MEQVLVNFKLDKNIKEAADAVFREIGISASAAYGMFARTVAREHRIPFELSADPFFSDQNMKALAKSIQQVEDGKVIEKTIDELLAMEG